ncbi:helix-turn-helix domain-containing protein [Streptomyces sp. NPDC004126]|uniref:helix-turn-helix domain-containing protein n=1 Tax=Streptomyces sp. NPDC004126 TaxID=3390695 RepID=UPI003CFEBF51
MGDLVGWQAPKVREASRAGNYGKVIELCRKAAGLTQKQVGQACGLSQSAVSRLENHGAGSYGTDLLAAVAAYLEIPTGLVGLAEHHALRDGSERVERREFLGGVAAVAASPLLGALPQGDSDGGQVAALRMNTAGYRRLDSTTPSRDLSAAVESHIRLIQSVTRSADTDRMRSRLAAVGSEAASLAGWLAWDMGDHGSARSWYGAAIRAARSADDPLLAAYQTGSLAQFEAHAGNGAQAVALAHRARRFLGTQRPAVADAWLSSVEALAHAADGDQRETDRALNRSRAVAESLCVEEPPPWPWVFRFDGAKVAACRVTCGARLGLSDWVLAGDTEALATGHTKQRALVVLDVAAGHLSAGRIDAAFAFASKAVETGVAYRSGRIVERARALRRSLALTSPPRVVREFDERLQDVYL